MTKKNNSNFLIHNIALYSTIIAILGLGTAIIAHYNGRKKARSEIIRLKAELHKNEDERFTYMYRMPNNELAQNKKMRQTRDSLANINADMLSNALQEYFDKIDKQYTLGCFFTSQQITKMNKILNFVGPVFNAKTPLSEFQEILAESDITADKFFQFGVILDGGYIHMFQDPNRQKLFEAYLDANDAAFLATNDTDMPNPAVVLDNVAHREFDNNKRKIDYLDNCIAGNCFIVGNTIAAFNLKSDSLRALLDKYQKKLR